MMMADHPLDANPVYHTLQVRPSSILQRSAVKSMLTKHLAQVRRRYSYRFLFMPGTIGSITWLSLNRERTVAIRHGLALTRVGDCGHVTYKRSRQGDALTDRAMIHVLKHSGQPYDIQDFSPCGYDERQY